MQDGWRVRVPASSANVGPAFDARRGRARHPPRGVRRRRRSRARDPSGRPRVPERGRRRAARACARAFPAGAAWASPRAARVAGLLAVARAARSHRPRGARRDVAGRDRARGPRRQRGRGRSTAASWRSPAATWCASRSPASSRSWCGSPSARPRPRAPAACFPSRCRSTTRCSTSAAPRCSSRPWPRAPSTRCASRPRTACTRTAGSRARATRTPRSTRCSTRARSRRGSRDRDRRPPAFVDRDDAPRDRGRAARPAAARSCSTSTTKERVDHMKLDGKCVVVTGAAGGIGAALARRFAAEGARAVVVADRDPNGIEAVAARSPRDRRRERSAVPCDVTRSRSCRRSSTRPRRGSGRSTCSARTRASSRSAAPKRPTRTGSCSLDVNVMAHVYAARILVPRMLERGGGYLLQTASAAGPPHPARLGAVLGHQARRARARRVARDHLRRPGAQGVGARAAGGAHRDDRRASSTAGSPASTACSSPTRSPTRWSRGLDAESFLILPHPQVLEYFRRKASDYERWLARHAPAASTVRRAGFRCRCR